VDTRRTAIWEACLLEFSEKGFDRASTNSIAERAGVSKGLVFHYFGSKERLYRELVEQCVADVEAYVLSETPEGMSFVGTMIRLSEVKLQYFKTHPRHFSLLMQAFYNPPEHHREVIQAIYGKMLARAREMVRQLLTLLPMRPETDPERALDLVMAISGIIEGRHSGRFKAETVLSEPLYQEMRDDYTAYLELLLHGISREDPL